MEIITLIIAMGLCLWWGISMTLHQFSPDNKGRRIFALKVMAAGLIIFTIIAVAIAYFG